MQLSLKIIAQGPEARATDSFILQLDDAQRQWIEISQHEHQLLAR